MTKPPVVKEGDLALHAVVLSILYAPPGIGSSVSYANGTAMGTSVDFSASTQHDDSVEFDIGFKGGGGGGSGAGPLELNGSQTGGWTSQHLSKDGYAVSKADTLTLKLNSGSDAINHYKDVFILWLNADFHIVSKVGPGIRSFIARLDSYPGDVAAIRWVPVTAGQLLGKDPVGRDLAKILARISDENKRDILALDPALNDPPSAHPDRYQILPYTSTVDSDLEVTFDIASSNTSSMSQTTTQTQIDTFGEALSIVLLGFKSSQKLTFSQSRTKGSTSGTSQRASVTLKTSTPNYTAVYDVYLDTITNTFVFAPDPLSAKARTLNAPSGDSKIGLAIATGVPLPPPSSKQLRHRGP